jgi:hypothetical protein
MQLDQNGPRAPEAAVGEQCRACDTPCEPFATALVLGHVDATYQRCPSCGLVMAVRPTWLPEAYSDAIAKLDIGLLDRCQILSSVTAMVLKAERLRGGRFLDWAGGYGTLTRMMRDRGYDFVHTDPMATNIFAAGHEVLELPRGDGVDAGDRGRYDLVTAFEVLEHLPDPVAALAPVAGVTDLLLTTTHLVPDPAPQPADWWYYTLDSGQHITFYTQESLAVLAERLGFDGVVTGSFVHLFHRGKVSAATRALVRTPQASYALGLVASLADRRHSLLARDLDEITG